MFECGLEFFRLAAQNVAMAIKTSVLKPSQSTHPLVNMSNFSSLDSQVADTIKNIWYHLTSLMMAMISSSFGVCAARSCSWSILNVWRCGIVETSEAIVCFVKVRKAEIP